LINENDSILLCPCGYKVIQNNSPKTEEELKASRKKAYYWFGLVTALILGIYCLMGFAMTGSFSVAAPAKRAYFEKMEILYLIASVTCFLLIIILSVFIYKTHNKTNITN
jgi:hypothetical protein